MFGLKRRQEPQGKALAAVQQTATVIPFPSTKVPERVVEPEEQRSYEEVAKTLGFKPAELVRAQLLEFFEIEGIQLYDYAQVEAWLSDKNKQAKTSHWCWRPLRKKDVVKGYRWAFGGQYGNMPLDGYYDSSDDACRPYQRLVPRRVLDKVASIEAKFGDKVKFFVSDYATPKPDPFIMVRPAARDDDGEYHFIFDVWDEPGFNDKA
ncbi:MAG: hypothetical protein UV22_C0020G0004 [Parcubacteria group bacterium GW2011_GWA2_42_35]|nr:MAG: hypothetical protein UV22_C0020G0004 [Parcubacteria group bacterium GW2011_GWA2_42_35]